jgi:hypothetical protein
MTSCSVDGQCGHVRSGLIRGERNERSIFYRPQLQFVRAMTVFLLKDCCEGRPELCEPVIADLVPCCNKKRPAHG